MLLNSAVLLTLKKKVREASQVDLAKAVAAPAVAQGPVREIGTVNP
jgi:hypothetical protein